MNLDRVKAVKEILFEDLVLCNTTHENAPPNKDCLDDCDVLKGRDGEPLGGHCKTKHKKCMDCWNEYIDALATQICPLFKVKLPKNPHIHGIHYNKTFPCPACVWDEFLQQVKEALEKARVEWE